MVGCQNPSEGADYGYSEVLDRFVIGVGIRIRGVIWVRMDFANELQIGVVVI